MLIDSNLNQFINKISFKKQYLNKLNNKINLLQTLKNQNYKNLNSNLFFINNKFIKYDNLIMYIIHISFHRTNTLLHVTDFSGKLAFFCSAGDLSYKGKSKKARIQVLKSMIRLILKNLTFLRNKPIALHLTNVRFMKYNILKKLKTFFFIKIVNNFDLYPYNGCRKRKARRKKF